MKGRRLVKYNHNGEQKYYELWNERKNAPGVYPAKRNNFQGEMQTKERALRLRRVIGLKGHVFPHSLVKQSEVLVHN